MMHIAQRLIMPLQSLVNFFSPPVPARVNAAAGVSMSQAMPLKPVQSSALPASALEFPRQHRAQPAGVRLMNASLIGHMPHRAARDSSELPLRILRSRRAQDGRIVIAGRMRDVCAELDRLCGEA